MLVVCKNLAHRNALAEHVVAALTERAGMDVLRRIAAGDELGGVCVRAPERATRALAAAAEYWTHAESLANGLEAALVKGALLFHGELFFEVHEVLEAAWLGLEGDRRRLVQGLIQIAVALHHLTHDNAVGARTLLREGRAKIDVPGADACGVDVPRLLATLGPWERAAAAGRWPAGEPLPVFHVSTAAGRRLGSP